MGSDFLYFVGSLRFYLYLALTTASFVRDPPLRHIAYSPSSKSSVTIPFHNVSTQTDFDFSYDPTIAYRILTETGPSQLFTPDLDTGSTSVVLGAGDYPAWNQNKEEIARDYPKGYEYLSSSEIMYYGYWVNSTIRFEDAPVNLIADFPILVVNESFYCSNYSNTTPGECPTEYRTPRCNDTVPCHIFYFGIGFGREGDGQEQSTPDKNALLNIKAINHSPLPDDYTVGYTITEKGVTVGLTQETTVGYEMIQLERQSDLPYDWQMVQGCLQVTPPNQTSNPCVAGFILLDTGVTEGFLRLTSESGITTGWKTSAKGGLYQAIGDGYNITAIFGNNQWRYSFISGEGPLAPTPNKPGGAAITANYYADPGSAAFLNTGIHFYKANSIVFDAVNGLWGVKDRSGSQQSSASTLAITRLTPAVATTLIAASISETNRSSMMNPITFSSEDTTTSLYGQRPSASRASAGGASDIGTLAAPRATSSILGPDQPGGESVASSPFAVNRIPGGNIPAEEESARDQDTQQQSHKDC